MPSPLLIGGLASMVGGLAAVPYLLASLVRKQLPAPSGKFRSVGSLVQRDASGLVVRLFYPLAEAAPEGERPMWLPEPQPIYIRAIGMFLNLPASIGGWLLGPGLRAARGPWVTETGRPSALPATAGEKLPVVCFSHGLGGFQSVYSLICTELASHGYIVVMPEHADSSAAVTTFPDDDTPIFCERSSEARMTNPATGEADGGFAWRNGQIQSRVEQIFTALGSLLRDTAQADSPWHGRVDTSRIVMAGHSFGGATCVAACAKAPLGSGGIEGCAFAGFRCGVVLDGWLFPIVGDGDNLDTTAIDRDFGHASYDDAPRPEGVDAPPGTPRHASTTTPLLFMDAASYLADRRWWGSKQDLVERATAVGQVRTLLPPLPLLPLHVVPLVC